MAVDEAILAAFCAGAAPPTLRMYSWNRAAISIGYFQSWRRTIAPESTVPVVRRPTGGRAVPHGSDLTFSLVAPVAAIGKGVQESYQRVGAAVACALRTIGIPAQLCADNGAGRPGSTVNCFETPIKYEVLVQGRKVLGSAQARRGDAVLQQNSLMLAPPPKAAVEAIASPFNEWPYLCERQAIEGAVIAQIRKAFGVTLVMSELTPTELALAAELERKYASPKWTEERTTCVNSSM